MIKVAAAGGKAIAFGFIPLILVATLFGAYLAFSPVSRTSNLAMQSTSCQQYTCVQININSNSPITGITVSLVPELSQCIHGLGCDLPSTQCNLPSNFCSTINTQSSTDTFTFLGVKEGYYWLEFMANWGNNATRGTARAIFVQNQMTYYVTANITASLATAEVNITNMTSG